VTVISIIILVGTSNLKKEYLIYVCFWYETDSIWNINHMNNIFWDGMWCDVAHWESIGVSQEYVVWLSTYYTMFISENRTIQKEKEHYMNSQNVTSWRWQILSAAFQITIMPLAGITQVSKSFLSVLGIPWFEFQPAHKLCSHLAWLP
jgi:hypothetical protein